jgi:hypothetical protein
MTQRYLPQVRADDGPLTQRVIELAAIYGRYGTPRITALLRSEGWAVNHKRVERIWRQAGLKVPQKQPKRGRLWLNDGSCLRLRPEHKDHVWAYDFVTARTHDGRAFRNDGRVAACFNPRHGIRASREGKTIDLVICFECLQVYVYAEEGRQGSFLTTSSPQPVFDQVLREAGVPLAKGAKK